MHLPRALKLGEFREHELQRILHAPVRVFFDAVAPTLHVSGGHAKEKCATPRLALQRLVRSLPEQRQLQLAHRTFHTPQQPIIGVTRIIDSILVDDNCADQSTELDQRVPIAAVSGKPRRFDRKDGTDPTVADSSHQPLEPWPVGAAARATEIIEANARMRGRGGNIPTYSAATN